LASAYRGSHRVQLCEPLGGVEYALFGISMAAVGMLSIVGMIVSNERVRPHRGQRARPC
jgi:Na+/H+-translocating membrane pyrophosphatase